MDISVGNEKEMEYIIPVLNLAEPTFAKYIPRDVYRYYMRKVICGQINVNSTLTKFNIFLLFRVSQGL